MEKGLYSSAYEHDACGLKEIAAGMHEEDNPVIMVAKYKR